MEVNQPDAIRTTEQLYNQPVIRTTEELFGTGASPSGQTIRTTEELLGTTPVGTKPMGGGLYREVPDEETQKRMMAAEAGPEIQRYQAAPKMAPVPSPSGDYLQDMAMRGELLDEDQFKQEAADRYAQKMGVKYMSDLPAGWYSTWAKTADALDLFSRKLSGAISKATNVPGEKLYGGVFDTLSKDWGSLSQRLSKEGLSPGLTKDVLSSLGEAGAVIPQIQAFGGYGLPVHGAIAGLAEGGVKGAVVGGVQGALTHGILGAIGGLPTVAQVPAAFGFGAATAPGGARERLTSGFTWAGLQMAGGNRPISVGEFIQNYPRIAGKINNAQAKAFIKRMAPQVSDAQMEEAGGAKKILDDEIGDYQAWLERASVTSGRAPEQAMNWAEMPRERVPERAPERVGMATVKINPNAEGGIDVEVQMPKKGDIWKPPEKITPEMVAEQKALRRQAAEELIEERAKPEIPGAKALRAKRALAGRPVTALISDEGIPLPQKKFGKVISPELSYEMEQPLPKRGTTKHVRPKPTEAEYYEANNAELETQAAILEATGRPEKDINEFIKNTFMDGEELKRITDEVIGGHKSVEDAGKELRGLVDATVAPVKPMTPDAIRRSLAKTLPELAIPREKWGEISRRVLENYKPEEGVDLENYIRRTAAYITGEGEARPKKGEPRMESIEGRVVPTETAAPEEIYGEKETKGIVRSVVEGLSPRERQIAEGIMADRSLREDAKIIGISAEAIRKARAKVLGKLKENESLARLNSFDRTIEDIAEKRRKEPKKEPSLGLSLRQEPRGKGAIPKYEFADKARETEWQTGRKRQAGVGEKIVEVAKHLKNIWTRTYEKLPNAPKFEPARFALKQLEKQRPIALYKTAVVLKEIVGKDPDLYDRFSRKVILDDFAEEIKQGAQILPFGFDKNSVRSELSKIDTEIAKYPGLKESIDNRKRVWDSLRESYIEAQEQIGNSVEEKLRRENYYRHQVLKYAEAKNRIKGTGIKLRTPSGRSFLRERSKGGVVSTLPINIDYLEAESEVMQQMLFDKEVANTLDKIHKEYGIEKEILAEAKRRGVSPEVALAQGNVPKGYVPWQPREGNVFYMANTISERTARKIFEGGLAELGLDDIKVGQALAVGQERSVWVIPEEIAETLDTFMRRKESNAILNLDRRMIMGWKKWILSSPTKILKYNIRNLSGDAEHVFVGNASSFKRVPRATKELYDFYVRDVPMTEEMRDFYERGGMQSTLVEQEIKELPDFKSLLGQRPKAHELPLATWKAYWKTAKGASNMREAVLRYANYLEYLDEMKSSPDGRPKNFGASNRDSVMALPDIKDRAYKLQNDLLGAYDSITQGGQAMREFAWPFWSWLEVNPKIYFGLLRNAIQDKNVSSLAGRKLAGSIAKAPITALRLGRFGLKAGAVYALVQAANHYFHGDEEEMLPDDVKATQHVVFGKDKSGETQYFSRIGALGDLFEWVGGVDNVSDVLTGRKAVPEFLGDVGKAAVNQLVQGVNPGVKLMAEGFAKKALFPDVFKPRPIRNLTLHFFRNLGLGNEYLALSDLPAEPYTGKLIENVIYKSDPLEASYYHVKDMVRDWMKEKGKMDYGVNFTPKNNALYYMKQAHRYGQKEEEAKFLKEYISHVIFESGRGLGQEELNKRISQAVLRSYQNMDPLFGIKKDLIPEFVSSLSEKDKRKLGAAYQFYAEVLIGNPDYKPEAMNLESPK